MNRKPLLNPEVPKDLWDDVCGNLFFWFNCSSKENKVQFCYDYGISLNTVRLLTDGVAGITGKNYIKMKSYIQALKDLEANQYWLDIWERHARSAENHLKRD